MKELVSQQPFVANTNFDYIWINVNKPILLILDKNEIQFVLAHELVHQLLLTGDEFVANKFAAEVTSPESGIGAHNKVATLMGFNDYLLEWLTRLNMMKSNATQ